MPTSRFTAVFRFDANSLQDAKDYGRGIRRAARTRNQHDWTRRDARLLRIKSPEGYATGTGRFEAVVKFNAASLADASVFGRDVRRAARAGVPAPRRGYRYTTLRQWTQRDAKLLRIVDPSAAAAPVAVQATGEPATTAQVVAEQAAPVQAEASAAPVSEVGEAE